MNRIHKLALSILSGILLSLSWPENGFPFLIFIALIPLLIVEGQHYQKRNDNGTFGIFWYGFITFLIFNTLTTYWIYNSTLAGAIAAIVLNSLFMSIIFQAFHYTHRKMIGEAAGYLALIGYWLSFEYLHLRWDLNWPWLNFGHVFAAYPRWIQWYEFTGVFGGSLWVVTVNILLYKFLHFRIIMKVCNRQAALLLISSLFLLVLPSAVSLIMYASYREKSDPVDVVVVQPNLDPYNEQYTLDPLDVTERMLELAAKKADSLTDFIVFPESAIQEYAFEDQLDSIGSIKTLRKFNQSYHRMNAAVGISTRKIFGENEPLSSTARKFRDADRYYDAYNTALYVAHDGKLQIHHKSKLTPGVEKMPYPRLFRFLENYAIDLGGTIGSLGVDNREIPFRVSDHLQIAPIICYESVYGEFLNGFIKNGASLIVVITNDGWWGNTPGHRQHLQFSVLRAIETRRSIARSANTGISCFINQRGDVSQRTRYWEPDVIRSTINANDKITFYVKHGDYIGRMFLMISAVMAMITIVFAFSKKSRGRLLSD
jgi:apolipoprotein N-acyltransferase